MKIEEISNIIFEKIIDHRDSNERLLLSRASKYFKNKLKGCDMLDIQYITKSLSLLKYACKNGC